MKKALGVAGVLAVLIYGGYRLYGHLLYSVVDAGITITYHEDEIKFQQQEKNDLKAVLLQAAEGMSGEEVQKKIVAPLTEKGRLDKSLIKDNGRVLSLRNVTIHFKDDRVVRVSTVNDDFQKGVE